MRANEGRGRRHGFGGRPGLMGFRSVPVPGGAKSRRELPRRRARGEVEVRGLAKSGVVRCCRVVGGCMNSTRRAPRAGEVQPARDGFMQESMNCSAKTTTIGGGMGLRDRPQQPALLLLPRPRTLGECTYTASEPLWGWRGSGELGELGELGSWSWESWELGAGAGAGAEHRHRGTGVRARGPRLWWPLVVSSGARLHLHVHVHVHVHNDDGGWQKRRPRLPLGKSAMAVLACLPRVIGEGRKSPPTPAASALVARPRRSIPSPNTTYTPSTASPPQPIALPAARLSVY